VIALALDSSTDRLSVALARPELPVLARSLDGARRHAAGLVPLIRSLLDEAGLAVSELTHLALADGPGGFTGLRVGAAVVKAMARAHPAVVVSAASTLMVRAAGAATPPGARVLVATSALRGEVYAAEYRVALPGSIETLVPPRLTTLEALHRETPDLLIADLPAKLLDHLTDQFAAPLLRGPGSCPEASALLALIGVPGGAETITRLDDWEPAYGRPAEAQARWEAAHGRALSSPAREAR
jgi:tRNA threonylcarbamoyl adenosine modification protein YeaZ